MRRIIIILMLCPMLLWAQEEMVTLKGRVTSGGHGVPYATVQLAGTSIGVSCNDDGEYTLKIPAGHENDTVLIRSIGYEHARLPVATLRRHSQVKLKVQEVQLREVQVQSYRRGDHLLKAAIDRIKKNYHQQTTSNIFFYRDWRAVDGELYLFDEAVMNVIRCGYGKNDRKRFYRFDPNTREMATDYKSILRHRLLVYDRKLLEHKVDNTDGIDELLSFFDNELFFDLLEAPKANFPLAFRLHYFEPVQEFLDNGEIYYLVRSNGIGRFRAATVHYEYIIRKSDLAIVRITSVLQPLSMSAPPESWVGVHYKKLAIEADSSIWTYDVREGKYTLTHYYNIRRQILTHRFNNVPDQRWQQSIEWTLTDFSLADNNLPADTLAVHPQTLFGAFGKSDYNGDYWRQYNSIPIDTLPLHMLQEKLTHHEKK